MDKKNEINSGDNSTNIQGRQVLVNQQIGISYSDARQIALDVYKQNFYELSEEAKSVALERAEKLIDELLRNLEKELPEQIEKIKVPDVQYTLIKAQSIYARNGGPDTLEILTNLLKDRFRVKEDSLKKIVLNEAIEIIPKLTINQLNLLTAIFLVKNCKMSKVRVLIESLDTIITDDLVQFIQERNYFEHLVYVGAASNDITTDSSQNLEYFIRKSYSEELNEKVEGNTLDVLDPPVRNQFVIDTLSESVFFKWNHGYFNRYALTSVGIALAVTHFNIVMNANIDLNIWIKG
ncbi:LPO_1073/Vpar_1526 family protein [Oceanobacillus massiliensis]|nr:LPO_1073/Vpar_1526 family protein [Oceanobacillus massiliensis]